MAAKRAELGIDQPYMKQLLLYLKGLILHLDFGKSYVTNRPVIDEIWARFPTTLKLAGVSIVMATVIGVLAGIISAIRQYSIFDAAAQVVSLTGVSIPSFWLALVLIILFSVKLDWLPPSGLDTPKAWILPCVTLSLGSAATIMRMTRSSMLDVIRQDYIRTARAKGQKESAVIMRHALKNALIPIITVIGMQLGGLLCGAVTIESIFSISGIGALSVNAIFARNTPVVQGCVILMSIVFCVINLLTDILYTFVDPRLRSQFQSPRKGKKTKQFENTVEGG